MRLLALFRYVTTLGRGCPICGVTNTHFHSDDVFSRHFGEVPATMGTTLGTHFRLSPNDRGAVWEYGWRKRNGYETEPSQTSAQPRELW